MYRAEEELQAHTKKCTHIESNFHNTTRNDCPKDSELTSYV